MQIDENYDNMNFNGRLLTQQIDVQTIKVKF